MQIIFKMSCARRFFFLNFVYQIFLEVQFIWTLTLEVVNISAKYAHVSGSPAWRVPLCPWRTK